MQPAFLGSVGVIVLSGVVLASLFRNPHQFVGQSGQLPIGEPGNSGVRAQLSPEERAQGADIDDLSLLLKDLERKPGLLGPTGSALADAEPAQPAAKLGSGLQKAAREEDVLRSSTVPTATGNALGSPDAESMPFLTLSATIATASQFSGLVSGLGLNRATGALGRAADRSPLSSAMGVTNGNPLQAALERNPISLSDRPISGSSFGTSANAGGNSGANAASGNVMANSPSFNPGATLPSETSSRPFSTSPAPALGTVDGTLDSGSDRSGQGPSRFATSPTGGPGAVLVPNAAIPYVNTPSYAGQPYPSQSYPSQSYPGPVPTSVNPGLGTSPQPASNGNAYTQLVSPGGQPASGGGYGGSGYGSSGYGSYGNGALQTSGQAPTAGSQGDSGANPAPLYPTPPGSPVLAPRPASSLSGPSGRSIGGGEIRTFSNP
jgi:hypothetical protein